MGTSPYVMWFEEVGKDCIDLVGGKNASLGELTNAGVRVPPGFAITTEAYNTFLEESGVWEEVLRRLAPLEPEDIAGVEQASRTVRELINSAPVPPDVEEAIRGAYDELAERVGVRKLPVAVRSSATAEDLPNASFAGQQDTFLWVQGAGHVLVRSLVCWSSLFTPRAITYRKKMGFTHDDVSISVGVQKMANAKAAGVMFTLNPVNGDRTKVALNANWGLGETVVAGEVTPDEYWIDKVDMKIVDETISPKTVECVPDPHVREVSFVDVPEERQTEPCLTEEEVIELVRMGKRIERHYGCPQDIEWAVDKDLPFPENIVILQSRPETVWSQKQKDTDPIVTPKKQATDYVVSHMLGMMGKKGKQE